METWACLAKLPNTKDSQMNITFFEKSDILMGNKLVLISTNDPYSSLKCGDTGIIDYVDDTGTIFVNWENGSHLAMIPGVDQFAVFFMESKNE